jgi:hypothetical protein
MTVIAYPRAPVSAVWQTVQPGQALNDGIDITTWIRDYALEADTISSVTATVTPSDMTIGSVSRVGNVLTVRHTGGADGFTYVVIFFVTMASGAYGVFPVALPVQQLGSSVQPPTGLAAITALFKSLSTTKPSASGVLWNDGGVWALS